MILQVQGFFKDMNAQCNVLNMDSLCYKWWPFWVLCLELWKMTTRFWTWTACVTSDDRFEFCVWSCEKWPQGSEISAKGSVKDCINDLSTTVTCLHCVNLCLMQIWDQVRCHWQRDTWLWTEKDSWGSWQQCSVIICLEPYVLDSEIWWLHLILIEWERDCSCTVIKTLSFMTVNHRDIQGQYAYWIDLIHTHNPIPRIVFQKPLSAMRQNCSDLF
jgi:hypothetical protein